jgi:lipoprotein-releasing system ATP-binding protein
MPPACWNGPTPGLIALDGRDCSKLSERQRTQVRLTTVGFVYQFHHLLPEFSAMENVAMPR